MHFDFKFCCVCVCFLGMRPARHLLMLPQSLVALQFLDHMFSSLALEDEPAYFNDCWILLFLFWCRASLLQIPGDKSLLATM